MNALTLNGASTGVNRFVQNNPSTSGDIAVGGIQVQAAAQGTPLVIGNVGVAGTSSNQSFKIPATYIAGNSRCVSMAMEVCNTTSELNKQGLCTLWRVPVPQNDDGTTVSLQNNAAGDTTVFAGSASAVWVPQPPPTIAAAQLFAGTKAHGAEEGCYMVAGFNTPDVPANGVNFTQPAIYATTQLDANIVFAHTQRNTAVATTPTSGQALVAPVYWTEFDMSGCTFTGLSNTSTLTVNYIVYIERFPTQDDLDLIVSAKRSPEYDIKALEAYSEIYQSLPVGVPFGENGWGDWFDTIANTATSVLSVVPHPWAQAANLAIKGAQGIKNSFDQPASNTRVDIPDAPPMTSAPRRERLSGATLKASRAKLKKVVTRENKFENRVRNELKGVGKIVRGKGAPRAPKLRR